MEGKDAKKPDVCLVLYRPHSTPTLTVDRPVCRCGGISNRQVPSALSRSKVAMGMESVRKHPTAIAQEAKGITGRTYTARVTIS